MRAGAGARLFNDRGFFVLLMCARACEFKCECSVLIQLITYSWYSRE